MDCLKKYVLFLSSHTHRECSFVVHLSHRDISCGRVHHEHLLIVTQLELCVEGVNHGNGPVGLLEGNGHQEPEKRAIWFKLLSCCPVPSIQQALQNVNETVWTQAKIRLGLTFLERELCRTEVCPQGRSRVELVGPCRGSKRQCTLRNSPSC